MHFESDPTSSLGSYYEESETSIIIINYNNLERILISFSIDEPSDIRINLNEMKPID